VTKGELVEQVAGRAELTKTDATRAVDAVIAGFGKFSVGERGARDGVNPRTGERIRISASRVPRFSAGSGLKSAVNSGR